MITEFYTFDWHVQWWIRIVGVQGRLRQANALAIKDTNNIIQSERSEASSNMRNVFFFKKFGSLVEELCKQTPQERNLLSQIRVEVVVSHTIPRKYCRPIAWWKHQTAMEDWPILYSRF